MPTLAQGYYTKTGKRVPSVTTVLSRFKDSGGLIHWASRLAFEPYMEARALLTTSFRGPLDEEEHHEALRAFLARPPELADYRAVRDRAAGIGTIVHARVDCHIRGVTFDPEPYKSADIPDPLKASENGFSAFLEWAETNRFELVDGEKSLISETYLYGGTRDIVAVHGKRRIGDWKTGDLYAEQLLPQLAAYVQLEVENGGSLDEGGHAISINKKTGGFIHRYFTPEEMKLGWQAFKLMRELYGLVKEMSGKAA